MRVYEVIIDGGYKGHYVEANGYDDAANKLLKYLEFEYETNGVLTNDGSLKKDIREIEVTSVKIVADFIIR